MPDDSVAKETPTQAAEREAQEREVAAKVQTPGPVAPSSSESSEGLVEAPKRLATPSEITGALVHTDPLTPKQAALLHPGDQGTLKDFEDSEAGKKFIEKVGGERQTPADEDEDTVPDDE
jgi:hypothetical protein